MATLKINLSDYIQSMDEGVEEALEQTADDITNIIKQLVPVDTGDLRDSYMWEKVEVGRYRIGSNPTRGVYRRGHPTFYAPFVEFGTYKQPHFVPAFEQALPTFQARLTAILRKKAKG